MQPLIDKLVASAAKAQADGRLVEAADMVRRALELNPREARALFVGGVVAARSGRAEEAVTLLERAAASDPNSFFVSSWLVTVLRSLGRSREALEWAQRAGSQNGPPGKAANLQGLCFLDLGELDRASEFLRAAAAGDPSDSAIQFSLAKTLQARGLNREAIELFRMIEATYLDSVTLLKELAEALLMESEAAEAVQEARKLLHLQPDSPSAHLALARSLIAAGRTAEADPHIQKSLAQDPSDSRAQALLGSLLQSVGRITEADTRFRQSIELDPNQGFGYLGLVRGRRMTVEDRPLIEKMVELADRGAIPERQAGSLHYAIGKANEDLGEYGEAMCRWDEANRIAYRTKFGSAPFDRRRHEETLDFVFRTYSKQLLVDHGTNRRSTEVPTFVLGMIRSGTTLVEQILSSHPQVGGAGEQRFWSDHRGDTLLPGGGLDGAKLANLAEQYCASLRELCPGKRLVVDKLPINYLVVGLLHIAFPSAPIIHVNRHPIDTCLSIYATPNSSRIEWAHDKANIAFAYGQYVKLMEHWRAILPPGRMLEVQYEELISDRERVTRQMLEHCGLSWDEACLHPEQNQRSVVTPSALQVRQPVYATSVDRWRRFEPWLGEIREAGAGR